MPDAGLIVGYLTAAVVDAAGRWTDRRLDRLLDRLTGMVRERMGDGPLDRLANNPGDKRVQRELGLTLDGALSVDRAFAHELAEVIAELDKRGGRDILIEVGDPTDFSRDPIWIKLCMTVGSLLALAAFGIFGYSMFTKNHDLNDPSFGQPPPGIALAAALFFGALVLLLLASLGHAFTKRR